MNLLFDLDGTLADPFDAFSSSLHFAFDELNVPRLSDQVVRSLIGPPLHPALPRLLGEKASLADEALKLYRKHHAEIGIYKYQFYAGMDQAVQHLGKKHRLFVATSKPKVYTDTLIEFFGKNHYFEFIYGSDLAGVHSKKGAVIRLAMSGHSLDPAETLMIGDREHDMIGAKENGIPAIGVRWGYGSADELTSSGSKVNVENWDELVHVISEMNSR